MLLFDGFGVLYVAGLFAGYGFSSTSALQVMHLEIDHLAPTKADRQLNTTSIHAFLREKRLASIPMRLRLGAGLTQVTGQITRLAGRYDDGTLSEVTLDSPAWGAGPEIEASLHIARIGHASVGVDMLGGVYYFDRDFPAGGARYNGRIQFGAHIAYKIAAKETLSFGYRWMHVSNGLGLNPGNPGYEAGGFGLRYSVEF